MQKSPLTPFSRIIPRYMKLFMVDFDCGPLDAAAVFGNLAHESMGFAKLQEIKPIVKGSRGGYGWAQWTGPRRRAYEAYCQRHGFDPAADETNYKYLFVELKGEEAAALGHTKRAATLRDKTIAFERAFLRAGIKHDQSRFDWAVKCLEALQQADNDYAPAPTVYPGAPAPLPQPVPKIPDEPRDPAGIVSGIIVGVVLVVMTIVLLLVSNKFGGLE